MASFSPRSVRERLMLTLSSEELFYQLGLRQFGNLPRLKLDPPPSLRVLISFAVEAEKGTEASGMNKEELVDVRVLLIIRVAAA